LIVGTFGSIIFTVSSQKILTFTNFSRSAAGRWGNHDIVLRKPLSEFLGPGQEEISFSVRLDVSNGIIPRDELAKMRDMRDTGEVSVLVIGGEPVTWNQWSLESVKEGHKVHTGSGKLIQADVELTLKEYVEEVT